MKKFFEGVFKCPENAFVFILGSCFLIGVISLTIGGVTSLILYLSGVLA